MQATDFYKELGVDRTADEAAIKRAYRKLAREHHPDVNAAPEAEERFKRITEAYAVLSDPEKKALYDKYGIDGLREGFDPNVYERVRTGGWGGQEIDLEELFGGFGNFAGGFPGFGGFGGSRTTGRRRGRNVELTLKASFEQAAKGFSTRFTYDRPGRCTACGGAGGANGTVCAVCRGTGSVSTSRTLTVNIPQGAEDGDRIRLAGKGGEGTGGGPPGDLVLTLSVQPHPTIGRVGIDLTTRAVISPLDAILGAKTDVATLDGSIRVTVPPGVASGQKLRLKGKGVTRGGKTGDLLVEIAIDAGLLALDDDARSRLEELRAALQRVPVE